jgi:hypothetical protein
MGKVPALGLPGSADNPILLLHHRSDDNVISPFFRMTSYYYGKAQIKIGK